MKKTNAKRLVDAVKELSRLLTLFFCALRACGVVTWEWYWVMSPLLISWALAVLMIALGGVVMMVAAKNAVEENPEDKE